MVERAGEMGMVKIWNKGGVGGVRAIVVGFINDGVSGDSATVDVDVPSVKERFAFKVEVGVKVVNPKHGLMVD